MEIRAMTISDYEEVYSLWASMPGVGLNTVDDSKAGIEKYLRRNPETCFVAVENDEIAGTILSGHDGRRGFIYHTAVAENYRHRGIGTALVNRVVCAMHAAGIQKIALVAYCSNEQGNAFWERMGFSLRNDLCYRNRPLS